MDRGHLEAFQPVPVRPPGEDLVLFWAKCLGAIRVLTKFSCVDITHQTLSAWAQERTWPVDLLSSAGSAE